MRLLSYVPMIHADEELNELGPIIKGLRSRIYGELAARQDGQAIHEMWKEIRAWVFKKHKDPSGLIIYQDGMPVGPREKIRQLFLLVLKEHPQSPLFCLTQELLAQGAVLEGTEDMALLQKRIAAYKEIYQTAKECPRLSDVRDTIVKRVEELDYLIVESDQFIARRVDQTLMEGEKGILFMGHRHRVDEELAEMQRSGLLSSPIQIIKLGLQINPR